VDIGRIKILGSTDCSSCRCFPWGKGEICAVLVAVAADLSSAIPCIEVDLLDIVGAYPTAVARDRFFLPAVALGDNYGRVFSPRI